ncbi:unnamed protein product, partial [Mesorhabditis spiculigera]
MKILLLLLLATTGRALIPKEVKLFVGEVGRVELDAGTEVEVAGGGELPSWMALDKDALLVLPGRDDVGKHLIQVTTKGKEAVIEFRVSEEYQNPCGETDSFWIEAIYEGSEGIAEMVEAAETIHQHAEIDLDKIRVYDPVYGKFVRNVTKIDMEEEGEAESYAKPFHVVVPGGCVEGSELDQDVPPETLEVMSRLIEMLDEIKAADVAVFRGRVRTRKERNGGQDIISTFDFSTGAPEEAFEALETTTTPVKTTTRRNIRTTTARNSADSAPVKMASLSSMQCKRGHLCSLTIPAKLFVDKEDGETNKLKLQIHAIAGQANWIKAENMQISAVPLEVGEFEMRLEARDKSNQMVSAPFFVSVQPSAIANHHFYFVMDRPQGERLLTQPHQLVGFVKQLASAFPGSSTENVTIERVEKDGDGRAIIYWSNTTLNAEKTCPVDDLEAMKLVMATKKQNKPKTDFTRAMSAQYMIRRIGLDLLGGCKKQTVDTDTSSPSVDKPSRESGFGWLALAAALALLLLLVAIALCCCLSKKPKKEKPSEFVSKGLPVVFPEEVADESDTAAANTPMLVKEERPPLKISHHENPLYKPPGEYTKSFQPRNSTPGHAGTPVQKLPPPYVVP